ncbi:hypothetical protein MMC20_004734 [Loxospora ochrophaea]|nr:hypothetical protein [Loxospora ochrophaea]
MPLMYAGADNTQSTSESRRTKRLSKPLTNTSQLNLLISTRQQTESAADQDMAISRSSPTIASPGEGRQDVREKMRAHLFGRDPVVSQESWHDEDDESKSSFLEAARSVKDRLSRRGTLISQLSSARASTTHLSQRGSRMSLQVDGLPPDAEDSNCVIEEIKEKAMHDHFAAVHYITPPADESLHADAVTSPIRRRSLFTPGLATRVPSDILRKPPGLEQRPDPADHDYFYNPTLSNSSPLSRLASLDLADEGRLSPAPRASTPCDLHYSHLGGLKYNSLRITNGTDSPASRAGSPDRLQTSYSPALNGSEDFYTASEGRSSDDEDASPVIKEIHRQSGEFVDLADNHARADSLIGQIGRIQSPGQDSSRKVDRSRGPMRSGRDKEIGHVLNRKLSRHSSSDEPSPRAIASQAKSDQASRIAQEYMLELSGSPFTSPVHASEESSIFQATSKANEIEDELFENEGSIRLSILSVGTGKRKSTVADSETSRALSESPANAFQTSDRDVVSLSGWDTVNHLVSSRVSHKDLNRAEVPATKPGPHMSLTDSGYSSNSSVESFKKEQVNRYNFAGPLPSALKQPTSARSPSGPRDMPSKAGTVGIPFDGTNAVTVLGNSLPVRPSIYVVANPTDAGPVPRLEGNASSRTTASLGSTISTETKKRRLTKTRPSSQPPAAELIVVQGIHELHKSNIPSVPLEIAEKHAKRLQDFPLLEKTFPSLHSSRSFDSVSSAEPTFLPVRFPSPTHASEDESSRIGSVKKTILERQKSHISRSLSFKYFKSAKESKSESGANHDQSSSQNDWATAIADFGTVTESLGGSPYDIARTVPAIKSWKTDNSTIAHPHHMSTATPRGKITKGMDEQSASRHGRARSQKRSQSLYQPRTPSFNDRGGIPGKTVTPQSGPDSIPPVPTRSVSTSRGMPVDRSNTLKKPARPKSAIVNPVSAPHPARPQQLETEVEHRSEEPRKRNPQIQFDELSEFWDRRTLREFSRDHQEPSVEEGYLRDHPKPSDSSTRDDWKAHREAWAQRRKSAVEGLARKALPNEDLKPVGTPEPRPDPERKSESEPRQVRARPLSTQPVDPTVSKGLVRSFHLPLGSSRGQQVSPAKPAQTSGSLKVPEGNFVGNQRSLSDRVSGRYDGGYSFGYEPGHGIGGSAGTRNVKSGASRKSVHTSLDYGIDLSDIPVFVARMPY